MRTVASFVLVLAVGADALVACGATKQRTGAGHDRSTPDASHPALDAAAPRLDAANPPVDVELYGATVGSSPARVTRCTRHSIDPCWCFMQAPSEAPFRASLGPEPASEPREHVVHGPQKARARRRFSQPNSGPAA